MLLGFILPCVFNIQVFRKELTRPRLLLDICIIVMGIFFGVIGTIEAIIKLLEDDDELADQT